ncbi:hypothetical protein VTK56DRAFT_4022 [Thermocarpiscus australiensis]
MVWSFAGYPLRTAMYMGLHRDAAGMGPKTITPLTTEMRRRLWNTVLELALQSSLSSGGPPLISLDDFDTEPPGNFDDDQLLDTPNREEPAPKAQGEFAQTTIAIALRRTFPQRLAIVTYLNDLSSRGAYAETLKLDSELRTAYRDLSRILQTCRSKSLATGLKGPSDYELRALDMLLRRHFLSLHAPFFSAALQNETAFAFSRKVVVETALRLWRAAFPLPLSSESNHHGEVGDLLSRLAIYGSGFFRTASIHAFVLIAAELRTLLREEESLGPVALRPDLLAVLNDMKLYSWRRVEAGATNFRGYLVACMVGAHVEALRRGRSEEEAAARAIEAAGEAEERALGFFEEVVAREEAHGEGAFSAEIGGTGGTLYGASELAMEDWDYMVPDALFNSGAPESLNWILR